MQNDTLKWVTPTYANTLQPIARFTHFNIPTTSVLAAYSQPCMAFQIPMKVPLRVAIGAASLKGVYWSPTPPPPRVEERRTLCRCGSGGRRRSVADPHASHYEEHLLSNYSKDVVGHGVRNSDCCVTWVYWDWREATDTGVGPSPLRGAR